MSSNLTLQEKINNRIALIKNLDENLVREQRSMRTLRDQLAEHEVAMAERDHTGTDNVRWTTWANRRLAGMQLQLDGGDKRIEKILNMIVWHEAAIQSFRAGRISSQHQPRFVAVSQAPSPSMRRGFEGKILADLDRKGPGKNPHRKYIAKGERKKSANAQPAKKEKAVKAKNEKRGRKAA